MRWPLRTPTYCTALFLILASLTFPLSLGAQSQAGSIVGQVRVSPGNFPPAPLLVTVETRGAVVNTAYTDNEGRFGINGLPGNIYHIVINEPEYQPVQETVNLNPATNPMQMVSIFLMPKESKKDTNIPSITGGNPNLADLSEYTKKAPKKAIKEFDAGVRADRDNKIEDAIKHYQNALAIAPDFYPAHNNLGTAFLNKSDYEGAKQQFELAVRINAADASAYFNLGNLFLLKKGYAEAKDWVERGLSRQPDSAFGHFIEGSIFTGLGEWGHAEATLRRCLELSPIMAKAHLALVNVYLQQHRKDEAIAELKLFVTSFPEDPLAGHANDLLRKLGSTTDSSR